MEIIKQISSEQHQRNVTAYLKKGGYGIFTVPARDYYYELLDSSWYLDSPWWGRKKFFYVAESCDCDDFNTILKYEWLVKHSKRPRKYKHSVLGDIYPALPVNDVLVVLNTGERHWCILIDTSDGVHFVERTSTSVRFVTGIKKVLMVR